jgi:hypothetical protein
MIISITKIELRSYSQLRAYFALNQKYIQALQKVNCKGFKATGSWNLKCWYTMSLWENEVELKKFNSQNNFIDSMRKWTQLTPTIQTKNLNRAEAMSWKEAKRLFD